jgi:glucosamine kinase
MTAPALYLGVDGGGSGCRARIETVDGEVRGQGRAGPATMRLGVENALASIMAAAGEAIAEAGLDSASVGRLRAAIGLAGFGRKGAREALDGVPHPFAGCIFTSDATAACLGAHGGADGGVVIAGTGSIGFGRVAGAQIRIGGYGFPGSDEGSGAHLGFDAIRAVLKAADGRAEQGALVEEVMARFGGDLAEVVAWMDRATASDYAALAPIVLGHAEEGDPTARSIMRDAASQIGGLVRALFDRHTPRVSLLGGLSAAMEPWLAPDIRERLAPARGDAISGAILLAKTSPSDSANRADGSDWYLDNRQRH